MTEIRITIDNEFNLPENWLRDYRRMLCEVSEDFIQESPPIDDVTINISVPTPTTEGARYHE